MKVFFLVYVQVLWSLFHLNPDKIGMVCVFRCIELDYPLLAEYDFRNDTVNADIKWVCGT